MPSLTCCLGSLARSLARLPARCLPPPGPLAAPLALSPSRSPAGSGAAAAAPAGPLGGEVGKPGGTDARRLPGGPTERRAPAGRLRGDPGQCARPRGRELVTPPPRRGGDAPARASPPARRGASRSFLGPRPPRLLGAPPAKLSLFSALSPQPPCLSSRWEGLGLPEVSGMGPGPIGCRRTRPLRGEGALAVSTGLGEGGLPRGRPRMWG